MIPRRARAALCVALLAGLAGCGGSGGDGGGLSPDAYGQRLHSVVVPLFASLKQVSAAGSASSLTQALRSSEVTVKAGSRAPSGIDPPAEAAAANDELLHALRAYESTIQATRRALAHGSAGDVQTQIAAYNTQSHTFGQELIDVKQKLDAAGIEVGRPSTTTSAG